MNETEKQKLLDDIDATIDDIEGHFMTWVATIAAWWEQFDEKFNDTEADGECDR